MAEKGLIWKRCGDICTYGTHSMVAKMCGFIAHIKAISPECISNHSIIHHQPPAVWKIPDIENDGRQGYKHLKLYKIKTTEFRNFQCTIIIPSAGICSADPSFFYSLSEGGLFWVCQVVQEKP